MRYGKASIRGHNRREPLPPVWIGGVFIDTIPGESEGPDNGRRAGLAAQHFRT